VAAVLAVVVALAPVLPLVAVASALLATVA